MKKLILILLLSSCSSTSFNTHNNIEGNYKTYSGKQLNIKQGKLRFNKDSSFIIGSKRENGSWEYENLPSKIKLIKKRSHYYWKFSEDKKLFIFTEDNLQVEALQLKVLESNTYLYDYYLAEANNSKDFKNTANSLKDCKKSDLLITSVLKSSAGLFKYLFCFEKN